MKKYINIDKHKIYCEMLGPENGQPLLYLHGGPGEGCQKFLQYQANRLSKSFRLIAIDQRGVNRSSAIKKDESFGINDIIEDVEEIREKLGYSKWSIIGHSFGGYLSTLYSIKYPHRVNKLILDCPSLDIDLSIRSLLKHAATIFVGLNKKQQAIECLEASENKYMSPIEMITYFYKVRSRLGLRIDKLYLKELDIEFFREQQTFHSQRLKTYFHLLKLKEEGQLFNPLLPDLCKLTVDTLLLRGEYDVVTCHKQLLYFLKDVHKGSITTIENCSHYLWAEEPDLYCKEINQFLTT